jgi:hypothetical protein
VPPPDTDAPDPAPKTDGGLLTVEPADPAEAPDLAGAAGAPSDG